MISLRAAINAKCKDCIYDPRNGVGNWRQQVSACTVTSCPLWRVRPASKPHGDGKKAVFETLAPSQVDDMGEA